MFSLRKGKLMITVKYVEVSLNEQIEMIKIFLSEPNYFTMHVANYFNLTNYFNKTEEERNLLLQQKVGKFYHNNYDKLAKKVAACQEMWNKNEAFINAQFQTIFGEKFDFNCVANVNFNPICPRFIESKEFDVDALDSDAGILETSLHEIIHFAWFKVWKEQFPNTTHADMNAPSLGWLISEIAVDPIFKNSGLKSYLVRKPAYDYFYKEKINTQNMLEVVNDLYLKSNSIKEFQTQMLNLIKTKEQKGTIIQEQERETVS